MRTRNLAKAAVTAVAAVAMSTTPALAVEGSANSGPEPWQPYTATDFVAPAGKYCEFDLEVTAVEDEEQYRIDARYDDGTPRLYEYRGTLVSRFTNLATGESVTRDLSGHGWQEVYPDGASWKSFTGLGPFGFGFRAEDDHPQGYHRFDGLNVITIDQDGTRHLVVAGGPAENLCKTLT